MIFDQIVSINFFPTDASSPRKEKKSESSVKKNSKTSATDAGTTGPCGLTQVEIYEFHHQKSPLFPSLFVVIHVVLY